VEKVSAPHLEHTEDLSVHLFSGEEVKRMLEDNEIKQSLMAAPLWKFMSER
jgi:ADP-ribose pyrophosphatase